MTTLIQISDVALQLLNLSLTFYILKTRPKKRGYKKRKVRLQTAPDPNQITLQTTKEKS